ncbi:hypothetical protein AB0M44_49330 [Streptosporangium subroseum]|uniref:hypothetical protein n=1 Tax=Streptosporangium subroseum TaxID=106412 RepID=UPI003421D895
MLFAQPVSRIARLTVEDVLHDGEHVELRLGEPPSPVPEPVADLLLNYIQSLHDSTLATNSTPSWLFPGCRTNQSTSPTTLRDALREIGLPVEKGRTEAIRQLVLQAPPPVIARALGYRDKSATRIAAEAGSPWSRYAPGDHTD